MKCPFAGGYGLLKFVHQLPPEYHKKINTQEHEVYVFNKTLHHELYQNQAHAQLHLTQALIPMKPMTSNFTHYLMHYAYCQCL
jgi:hypothetical protein